MGKLVWKILGGLAAVLAGVVADRALHTGWKLVTGDDPPTVPEDPETNWPEAVGWAVASGVAIGVARLLATREAARYFQRSTGHLPPGLIRET